MKLLLDQNLSSFLCDRLRNIFPGLSHVKLHDLQTATDTMIWEFSKNNSYTIVTKDSDFNEIAIVNGFPPKLIWIKKGNCSSEVIENLLIANFKRINNFITDTENAILIID